MHFFIASEHSELVRFHEILHFCKKMYEFYVILNLKSFSIDQYMSLYYAGYKIAHLREYGE